MDGARNALALLEIDFWEMEIVWIGEVILNIFPGRLVNDLSHGKSLDGLIFWVLSTAIEAV